MNTPPTLTMNSVVEELSAELLARRVLGARRDGAYRQLAQCILGTTDHTLRPHFAVNHTGSSMQAAA